MSLLLLFPSDVAVSTATGGWTIISCPGVGWTTASCDAANSWGDWSSSLWSAVGSFTWNQLAGLTFVTTSCPATTWTATTC